MDKDELKRFLGNKIKSYRKERGWTQAELAEKLNIGKSAIANYENGIRSPRQKLLFQMAKVFDIQIDELFPSNSNELNHHSTSAIQETYDQLEDRRQLKVLNFAKHELKEQIEMGVQVEEELFPYLVAYDLSAGLGEVYYEGNDYETVYFDKNISHDAASWINGDSMEPKFKNGDVALIKDTGWDYNGAIYAIQWDGNLYIKKAYKEQEGLRLVSLNNKYADKFAHYSEDPKIIGKIVGHFTPIKRG